jgi:transcriptional regulator with XRE-family HTH domain
MMGDFIRHHRLRQNKTQQQLATEAGINRSTLVAFEQGQQSTLITLIQLLRALQLLQVLDAFQVEQQLSPLQLAALDLSKRKRASKVKPTTGKKKSDW